MVTARQTPRVLRTRSASAGPLRLLWLAALLLGLLYTHGLSGESVAAHAAANSVAHDAAPVNADASGLTAEAPDAHSDDRHQPGSGHHGESDHAEQDCLTVKPQHNADLSAPCATPRPVIPPAPTPTGAIAGPIDTGPAQTPVRELSILRI